MATLSAAELQKRHGLEGAPDPFPSLGNNAPAAPSTSAPAKPRQPATPEPVDTSNEDAFPALGSSSGPAPATTASASSKWGAASASKVKARVPVSSAPGGLGRSGAPLASSLPASISFSVPSANITVSPKVFTELTKKVKEQYGCSVEASTQMKTGLRTFFVRGPDDKRVALAKKTIERGISKVETQTMEVPLSTLGTIIGPKGANLKVITDATGCRIDIPRRDQLPTAPVNGHKETNSDESDSDDDEEVEDPAVPISLTGPTPAIVDAKNRINALIKDKVSFTSVKIKDIPSEYYLFIAGPKGKRAKEVLEQGVGQGQVQVHIPPPSVWKALASRADAAAQEENADSAISGQAEKKRDIAIRIKGDKDKVAAVVDEIRRQYEEYRSNSTKMVISIPKRQHRFLVGSAADEILEEHGCIVELPAIDSHSEECVIRGPKSNLIAALTTVMDKANAIGIETVDLVGAHKSSDAVQHAKNVLRYLIRTSKLRQIADAHSGVKVYPPFQAVVESVGNVVIEIVGEDEARVSKAKEELSSIVKTLTPAHIASVDIDFALHKFLIGKKGAKINQFETAHSVTVVFPPTTDESSTVLLVYTGTDLPTDKKQRDSKLKEALAAASKDIESLAKEAADIKTETLEVEQKWHRHVIGPGGSVLRSILGEDPLVTVSIGKKDGKADQDVIVVRGPSTEVDRIVPALLQVVEDAKDDDIVNGHTVEFSVEKRHVPHLVGQAGATINKLRESLGVRVNFDDDEESTNKKGSKNPTVSCKIVGRKEAVEEAKQRLQAQIERLADETTEVITIKRALHPALIGSSGKYAIRLEDKYGVKITFPRDTKDGAEQKANQKPDEVVIRGGKKGVAGAKAELLEAAEFEKETNQTITFTVPTTAVARILGKAGANINAIKDDTGAQIDVDKTSEKDTSITLRGDKQAIAAAKSSIQAVVAEVGDRKEEVITIPNKFHGQLIGPGGQRLRDLIVRVGGPEDRSQQAGLINFPRAGDASPDTVKLRGDKSLVNKIKAELERLVTDLGDQVVLGVRVPVQDHASRIGRGGAALQDLQRKSGATIQFPGSRQYNSTPAIENAEELGDVPANELIKVAGTREQCQRAIEVLSQALPSPPSRSQTPTGRGNGNLPTRTVSVPAKYFHALIDGQIQRQLRQNGIQVELPAAPAKPEVKRPEAAASQAGAQSARIDVDEQDENAEQIDYTFEVYDKYEGLGEAGDASLDFVIRGKDEVLDKGEQLLQEAVEKAKAANKVGVLVGIPRSAFPRIIGSKGATISRLRSETGADITVGKDDDLITLVGDAQSVEYAKDAIVSIASRRGARF